MTCIRLLISQGYPFNYFFFTGELFFKQIPFLRTAVFLTSSADTVIEIARNFFFNMNFIEGKIHCKSWSIYCTELFNAMYNGSYSTRFRQDPLRKGGGRDLVNQWGAWSAICTNNTFFTYNLSNWTIINRYCQLF